MDAMSNWAQHAAARAVLAVYPARAIGWAYRLQSPDVAWRAALLFFCALAAFFAVWGLLRRAIPHLLILLVSLVCIVELLPAVYPPIMDEPRFAAASDAVGAAIEALLRQHRSLRLEAPP